MLWYHLSVLCKLSILSKLTQVHALREEEARCEAHSQTGLELLGHRQFRY